MPDQLGAWAELHDQRGPDAAGWGDQGWHQAADAANDNVFWQWNYTTGSWDYWELKNANCDL